jgi:hypothetical protein
MRGGLPHRPGYAVIPKLEPGAVRRAMALRGMRSCHGSAPDESFRRGTSRFRSCAPATSRRGRLSKACGLGRKQSTSLAVGRASDAAAGGGRIVGFDRRPEEDVMETVGLLDRAGRRRSRATLSGFHQGRVPRNKGLRYPPDPPPVEEIIAVMRAAGDSRRRRGCAG